MPEKFEEMIRLGQKLKKAREEAGLDQKAAAKELNLDQGKISLIEKGARKVDAATELPIFAKTYKKPISWFFEKNGETTIKKMIRYRYPDLDLTPELVKQFEKLINTTIDTQIELMQPKPERNQKDAG